MLRRRLLHLRSGSEGAHPRRHGAGSGFRRRRHPHRGAREVRRDRGGQTLGLLRRRRWRRLRLLLERDGRDRGDRLLGRTVGRDPPGRESRPRLRQPPRLRERASRRDGARPGLGRGHRLLPRGARSRAIGPRDRRGHDARDDRARARQRREGLVRERRVPARRDRAPAGRRRERGPGDLELRDQPLARQAAGVPRGVPRAQARRPRRGERPRAHSPPAARAEAARGPAGGLRRRRLAPRRLPAHDARGGLRRGRDRGRERLRSGSAAGPRGQHRARGAARGALEHGPGDEALAELRPTGPRRLGHGAGTTAESARSRRNPFRPTPSSRSR